MQFLGFDASHDFSFKINNYYDYDYKYFNMQPHSHRNAEIMHVEHGECEICIHTKNSVEKLTLKKNQFIVLNSMTMHSLLVKRGKDCRVLNVELSPCPAENGINFFNIAKTSSLPESIGCIELYKIGYDISGVQSAIKRILAELTAKSYNLESEHMLNALILQLIISLARSLATDESPAAFYVRKALKFIEDNFSGEISVEQVARHAELSPIYLQRQIKKYTGKTILSHINYFRIQRAKKLLENTALPLIDIAIECGFGSRQTFYESFKMREGISPGDYRKKCITERLYNQTPYNEDI